MKDSPCPDKKNFYYFMSAKFGWYTIETSNWNHSSVRLFAITK